MRAPFGFVGLFAVALAGLVACKAGPPDATALFGGNCNDCHGSSESPAPPRATSGATSRADLAVGAHQAHLRIGSLDAVASCSECHAVPEWLESEGHVDGGPAEVSWGPLATRDGATPVWVRSSGTCTDTYCHGATLDGGSASSPSWTSASTGPLGCDGCHGAPPPPPHPASASCGACHPGVAEVEGALGLDPLASTHLDGTVELTVELCAGCHGGPANAAPPRSTTGAVETSDLAVGAHQSHVQDGPLALAIACQECHVVPTSVDEPSHQDASPAEITWGVVASGHGLAPQWDRESATCSEVYCHGATLSGGMNDSPVWTTVDGSQAFCGTCHGLPPAPPHPANPNCRNCHQATIDENGALDVAGGKHVDGVADFVPPASGCSACHGGDDNAAPPTSTTGLTSTTEVAVGAHQTHVAGGALRGPIPCQECHVVPTTAVEPTHMDGLPAEVVWGVIAQTGGLMPAWDATSETCAVYCHGVSLDGGSHTTPRWTIVDGTEAACGSCHGLPPPAPHPPRSDCWKCHGETVNELGEIDLAGGKHVNGIVDVAALGCQSCHGGPDNAAPPVSTTGTTDTTDIGVGAHQTHLRDGWLSRAVPCAECHMVPTDPKDGTHMDAAPAEVVFGPVANALGATPSWDHTTATCAQTHCHTLGGGALPAPVWTNVKGYATCGSCHGLPPPSHGPDPYCEVCHAEAMLDYFVVNPDKHINGTVEVTP